MSRPARRAVRRFECAACLFSLTLFLAACVTGSPPPRPVGPVGFGVTTTERIVVWIWDRLRERLPGLTKLSLWENANSGVTYAGEPDGAGP